MNVLFLATVCGASSVETNRPNAAVMYAVPMAIEQTQSTGAVYGEPLTTATVTDGAPVYSEPLTTATVTDGAPVYGEALTTATVTDGAVAYSEPLTTAYATGVAVQGDQTYIYVRPRAIDGKCLAFRLMHAGIGHGENMLLTSMFT